MKKILMFLLCLSLLMGTFFAQENLASGLTVEAKGSVTLSWGIDLGAGEIKAENLKHGFFNENKLKIVIPFFANEQSFSSKKADDADVYADINFKVKPGTFFYAFDRTGKEHKLAGNLREVAGYDVDAKLVFFGAYITVFNKPFFGSEFAIGWEPINEDDGDNRWWFNPEFSGFGTKIGYANEDLMNLDLGLKVGSNKSWKDDDATGAVPKPTEHLYGVGFDFSIEPIEKLLTVDATVNSIFHSPERYGGVTPGVGGKDGKLPETNFGLKLGTEPIDKLKIGLGFDGVTGHVLKSENSLGWDLGLTVEYNWVDFALYVAGAGTTYGGINKNLEKTPDLSMHVGFTSKDEGDTNFVPGLAFNATVNVYNLVNYASYHGLNGWTLPVGFTAGVSYKANITDAMWLKPFANVWGETNYKVGADYKFGVAYNVGLTYSPIEKAEITAKWAQGSLYEDTYEGGFGGQNMLKKAAGLDHNGTFTLGLTLKF